MTTRWEAAGPKAHGYAANFAELVATGADVDGEARLADTLLPRTGRVLDAGSGMGRVAAALTKRGHDVVAIEPDPALVEQSLLTYPDVPVLATDILGYPGPGDFDLVVCVGNVMKFLAVDSEVAALAHLRSLLAPNGRILVGFHLQGGPKTARSYTPDEFTCDVEAAGLRVDARFGSYELHPPNDEYAVWLLAR